MTTAEEFVDFLCLSEHFRGVPREQIEWLVRESKTQTYPQGLIFQPGDVFDDLIIILEGGFQAYSIQSGQRKVQMSAPAGSATGQLPFSRMKGSPVYIEALEPTLVLSFPTSRFHDLLRENYELVEVLVHAMTDRVRHFTTNHWQSEKLMALGKLSAGVAHEMNNPASAIVRNAADLQKHTGSLSESLRTMAAIALNDAEIAVLTTILNRPHEMAASRLPLLERKKREDQLLDWLDDHGIQEDCVTTFVEFGFTSDELEEIRSNVPSSVFPSILLWLTNSLEERKAIHEIWTASKRISELVQSVKNYTRMDQVQDMQEVRINDGIHNTLTMLEHKMRRNSVEQLEELADDIPPIMGFPGELNQVWTNIIDNALDAMPKGGVLTVRTASDAESVTFSVSDTGSGISPENLERIFDPFFTTKEVGEGTGVGLDLVQKIVKQHQGTVKVTSQPGHTEFRISFPRTTPKQAGHSV